MKRQNHTENVLLMCQMERANLEREVAVLRNALHSCKVQTWSNQEEGLDAAVYMRETARAALKVPA